MSLLSTGKTGGPRIVKSVKFTEEYGQRLKQLLEPGVSPNAPRAVPPIRCLLLQDCWGGQEALAVELGRDNVNYGHLISVVGSNIYDVPNKFKLRLLAKAYDVSGEIDLGISGEIGQWGSNDDFATALFDIESLTPENTIVSLGNPYYNNELIVYGNVVPASERVEASSPLGCWYVYVSLPQYKEVYFRVEDANVQGATAIHAEVYWDLPSPEVTVVTDTLYRPEEYAYQAGTIVSCLDYRDIGYGILMGSTRNFNVVE